MKQVVMYKKFKEVLDKVQDGDSLEGRAMRSLLSVNQIKIMEEHIVNCEDAGINLLVPTITN